MNSKRRRFLNRFILMVLLFMILFQSFFPYLPFTNRVYAAVDEEISIDFGFTPKAHEVDGKFYYPFSMMPVYSEQLPVKAGYELDSWSVEYHGKNKGQLGSRDTSKNRINIGPLNGTERTVNGEAKSTMILWIWRDLSGKNWTLGKDGASWSYPGL